MKPHKKDKLKLKPTLKEKRHYIIIELISKEKLNNQDVKNKIESAIRNFIGSLGLASAGPLFVKIEEMQCKCNNLKNNLPTFKENNNLPLNKYIVTLSILTKYVDYVKASLTLFKDKDVSMRCIGVSGTIKKSERFI